MKVQRGNNLCWFTRVMKVREVKLFLRVLTFVGVMVE